MGQTILAWHSELTSLGTIASKAAISAEQYDAALELAPLTLHSYCSLTQSVTHWPMTFSMYPKLLEQASSHGIVFPHHQIHNI